MTSRAVLQHEYLVDAAASSFWRILRDWAGLAQWWPEDAPIRVSDCYPVGSKTDVPFGRILTLASGETVTEWLISANDATRRIYYFLEDGSIPPAQSYLCSVMVDEVEKETCRVKFSSMFDSPSEFETHQLKTMMITVYDTIASGIGRAAKLQSIGSREIEE